MVVGRGRAVPWPSRTCTYAGICSATSRLSLEWGVAGRDRHPGAKDNPFCTQAGAESFGWQFLIKNGQSKRVYGLVSDEFIADSLKQSADRKRSFN